MKKKKKKCVNMISGGIDSSVLTLRLLYEGYKVFGIIFDYGQENFNITYSKAKKFTEKYGVSLKVIKIPTDWVKSSILKGQQQDEKTTVDNLYKQDIKEMFWIPARATLFWSLAGSYASSLGIEEVYSAIQMDKEDWNKYDLLESKSDFPNGELTPEFMKVINEMAKYSYKTPIKFIAPFLEEKAYSNKITLDGKKLGLWFNDTYSCRYFPECNRCAQCLIRKNRLKYIENE